MCSGPKQSQVKSLMNKHIVKHSQESLGVNDPFLGALYPSKSGLMNKHIVNISGVPLCGVYCPFVGLG